MDKFGNTFFCGTLELLQGEKMKKTLRSTGEYLDKNVETRIMRTLTEFKIFTKLPLEKE